MPEWVWNKSSQIEYITIPEWAGQGVNIAFTSRQGGVSHAPYASLNLGLHVEDKEDLVLENRQAVLQLFSGGLDQLVCCQQVHSANVLVVDEKMAGRGAKDLASALPDCDAMVCNTPGLILATFYADCFPVFFFDPRKRAVGLAHSGWKGTMGRIASATMERMREIYGSSPEDIEALIGPGIGVCCFMIQEDLADRVKREFPSFHEILQLKQDHYYWDLKTTIRHTLLHSGCLPDNIGSCDLCTSCRPELFFSYRRDNGITGRMGAFIGLNP